MAGSALREARRARRSDAGVTTAEYLGVLVVVAALVAALAVTPIGAQVSGGLRQAICAILGEGVCAGSATVAGAGSADGSPDGSPDRSGDGSGGGSVDGAGGASPDGDGSVAQVQDSGGCSGFWCTVGGAVAGVGRGIGSAVWNAGGAAWDDVTGVVDLVQDPGLLLDAGKAIWNDPLGVAGQLIWDTESRDLWGEGDYGGAIGRTVWNVGSIVVSVTKAGKAGKVGSVAGTVDDWAGLAADARKAADAASDAARAGDAAKAIENAAEARRIADEAAARARALGCPLAAPQVRGGGGGRGTVAAAPIVMADPCSEAKDAARQADDAADAAEDTARIASAIDIESGAFAQKTYSETFSEGGRFTGRTVDDVATDLRSGALAPADVPVDVIVRDGHTLILNTRSAQALTRAGIPRASWQIANRTGDDFFEALLDGQLRRNRLDSSGIASPRSTG